MVELNECRTLMMKFVIIGKTVTSNEKTVFEKTLLCYENLWKTTLWSTNWNMGRDFIAAEKEHIMQLTKMAMKQKIS